MRPNGLAYSARLHLKRDFERILQTGAKYQGNGLVLWCKKNNQTRPARMAIVVSRKLGPAVVRNRVKRIIREVFRTDRTRLVPGAEIIISPRDSETLTRLPQAQKALAALYKKAALLRTERPNEEKFTSFS